MPVARAPKASQLTQTSVPLASAIVMFNLACVPPEVWEEIFRLACTDGGYTGGTLALTSTSFRAYSFRVRFRTLAFTSLLHLPQFLDLLSRHGPARIEHLYLLFNNDPASKAYTGTPCNRMGYDAWRKTLSTRVKAYSTVVSLLRAAAPTLQTLCVVSPCAGGYLLRPPPCKFPLLEELSWMGGHSRLLLDHSIALGDADSASTAWRAVYPVLKRVHCIMENPTYAVQVVTKLAALASASLTHLRISALDHRASDVPDVLERVLGVQGRRVHERAADGISATGGSRVSPFRCIIVHSAAPPQDDPNENIDGVWAELSARIASVMDACDGGRGGIRGLYLERPFRRNPRWPERLRNDWTARIEGWEGCWVESEEEENALERQPTCDVNDS